MLATFLFFVVAASFHSVHLIAFLLFFCCGTAHARLFVPSHSLVSIFLAADSMVDSSCRLSLNYSTKHPGHPLQPIFNVILYVLEPFDLGLHDAGCISSSQTNGWRTSSLCAIYHYSGSGLPFFLKTFLAGTNCSGRNC